MSLRELERKIMRTGCVEPSKDPRSSRPYGLKDQLSRSFRLFVLRMCQGNRTHAANILGETVRGLRANLKKYKEQGCDVPDSEACTPYIRYDKIQDAREEILKILERTYHDY